MKKNIDSSIQNVLVDKDNNIMESLMKKIIDKSAVVGVIGLGYVGLPLAVEKSKAGYKTIGFDIQSSKVEMVNNGVNYIGDIINNELLEVTKNGMLVATSDLKFIREVDCVAICVPTPLDEHNQPDLSYIKESVKDISKEIHKGMLVLLESTTYPGTTEELVKPMLESSGLVCGKDFFLAFSPERVDPGNINFKTKNTPKVVGGVDIKSTKLASALYKSILSGEVFEVSSPKVAEMEKLLENIYRSVNIALSNEMAIICNEMGVDVWEVIEAAKTKPYGFQAFYPGPGVGGHCIPLDPYYLTWKAKEYNCNSQLIEAAGIINGNMPSYIVKRTSNILNKYKKSLNGSKVLLLGIAYKQDIDDYRESPAVKVFKSLINEGALVKYYDPYIETFKLSGNNYNSIKSLEGELLNADIVIITTMHSSFDYNLIQEKSKVILDTKNAMKNINVRNNIELL